MMKKLVGSLGVVGDMLKDMVKRKHRAAMCTDRSFQDSPLHHSSQTKIAWPVATEPSEGQRQPWGVPYRQRNIGNSYKALHTVNANNWKKKTLWIEDKETRKKVLHTQKMTQSRYLVFLASGYKKKSSIWHPEWHVGAYSVIGRLQNTSATNPPVVTDQDVSLHPILPAVQLTTNLLVLLYFFLLVYFPLNKYYSILILSLLL